MNVLSSPVAFSHSHSMRLRTPVRCRTPVSAQMFANSTPSSSMEDRMHNREDSALMSPRDTLPLLATLSSTSNAAASAPAPTATAAATAGTVLRRSLRTNRTMQTPLKVKASPRVEGGDLARDMPSAYPNRLLFKAINLRSNPQASLQEAVLNEGVASLVAQAVHQHTTLARTRYQQQQLQQQLQQQQLQLQLQLRESSSLVLSPSLRSPVMTRPTATTTEAVAAAATAASSASISSIKPSNGLADMHSMHGCSEHVYRGVDNHQLNDDNYTMHNQENIPMQSLPRPSPITHNNSNSSRTSSAVALPGCYTRSRSGSTDSMSCYMGPSTMTRTTETGSSITTSSSSPDPGLAIIISKREGGQDDARHAYELSHARQRLLTTRRQIRVDHLNPRARLRAKAAAATAARQKARESEREASRKHVNDVLKSPSVAEKQEMASIFDCLNLGGVTPRRPRVLATSPSSGPSCSPSSSPAPSPSPSPSSTTTTTTSLSTTPLRSAATMMTTLSSSSSTASSSAAPKPCVPTFSSAHQMPSSPGHPHASSSRVITAAATSALVVGNGVQDARGSSIRQQKREPLLPHRRRHTQRGSINSEDKDDVSDDNVEQEEEEDDDDDESQENNRRDNGGICGAKTRRTSFRKGYEVSRLSLPLFSQHQHQHQHRFPIDKVRVQLSNSERMSLRSSHHPAHSAAGSLPGQGMLGHYGSVS